MKRWNWSPWRLLLWQFGYLGLGIAKVKIESLVGNPVNRDLMRRKRAMLRNWLKFGIHLAQKYPANPRKQDYEQHWNFTSFKDKTILDIGADYGSTACWFLGKGAKRIVAVEGHPAWGFGLRYIYGKDSRVLCIQKWISHAEDFERLVTLAQPDLVKVDVEGAEEHLLKVEPDVLTLPAEWMVEAHEKDVFKGLLAMFRQVGFRCRVAAIGGYLYGHSFPSTVIYCKQ